MVTLAILFENGRKITCTSNPIGEAKLICGQKRDSIEIRGLTSCTYSEIMTLFCDNCKISLITTETIVTNGETQSKETITNLYDYCVAGPVTNNRNGTFNVIMGKKTETEKLQEINAMLLLESIGGAI